MARSQRKPQPRGVVWCVAVALAWAIAVAAVVAVVSGGSGVRAADDAGAVANGDASTLQRMVARHQLERRQQALRAAAVARRSSVERVAVPTALVPAPAAVLLQMQQRVSVSASAAARVRDDRDIDPAAIAEQRVLDAERNAVRVTDPNAPKPPPAAGGAGAGAGAGIAVGNDQLQSHVPYFDAQRGVDGGVAHALTNGEREYTPESQLDALLADEQRREQQAQLQQFNARLDTQVLVRRAKQLTAHIAKVANARGPGAIVGSGVLTPLTAASTRAGTDAPRFASVPSAADALQQQQQQRQQRQQQPDGWLGNMRLASARHAESAAERIAERAVESVHAGTSVKHHHRQRQRQRARHGARHLHRNHQTHHLNLGERVTTHNRARGRERGGARAGAGADVGVGGDGDVEDEKYMATDEAKEQETEYEPDESSNNWWWDYWSPYIA